MSEQGQMVAQKKSDPVSDIQALISSPEYVRQFKIALPKHLTPDRFVRIAVTAITKNPKLALCTQESLISCLLDLSALGLEPDGRRAHLVPFNNTKTGKVECKLLIDYKGLVELAMNTKEVSNIHADVVCENDLFEYNCGEVTKHVIDFRKDRGAVYAAYCIITMKDGTKKAEVMTKKEIEAIRKRSKAANDGPWVTDWNEMAKKTVFRRGSKWIKLSPEVREKIEKDDDFTLDVDPADPMVALKNDKNRPTAKSRELPPPSEAPADAQIVTGDESPDAWKDIGDLARFGKDNQTSAKNLSQTISKCIDKLGKEEFLKIQGGLGHERMTQITKMKDLVDLTNAVLQAIEDRG